MSKKPEAPVYYETYKEKGRITQMLETIKTRLNKPFIKRKPVNKLTKVERSAMQEQQKRAILGIGLLLVVVSITFSTFVTITFVDDKTVYIALAPQVAFAVLSLLKAFSKIYK